MKKNQTHHHKCPRCGAEKQTLGLCWNCCKALTPFGGNPAYTERVHELLAEGADIGDAQSVTEAEGIPGSLIHPERARP